MSNRTDDNRHLWFEYYVYKIYLKSFLNSLNFCIRKWQPETCSQNYTSYGHGFGFSNENDKLKLVSWNHNLSKLSLVNPGALMHSSCLNSISSLLFSCNLYNESKTGFGIKSKTTFANRMHIRLSTGSLSISMGTK